MEPLSRDRSNPQNPTVTYHFVEQYTGPVKAGATELKIRDFLTPEIYEEKLSRKKDKAKKRTSRGTAKDEIVQKPDERKAKENAYRETKEKVKGKRGEATK